MHVSVINFNSISGQMNAYNFILEPDLDAMCYVRYRNIGCYNDFHMRQRPLPVRLLPEQDSKCLKLRDLKVIMNNETLMKAWNDNMYQFVCRCAEAAKKGEYDYFGVQNCGKLICGNLILVGGAVVS